MTPRLRQQDIGTLLGCLRDIYGQRSIESFAGATVTALQELVPSDAVSYNEVDPTTRKTVYALIEPPTPDFVPEVEEIFRQHMPQHPFFSYFRKTGVGSIRSRISTRNPNGTDLRSITSSTIR